MSTTEEVSSVPALAVTAAVGAVILLIMLLCNMRKKTEEEEEEEVPEEKENKPINKNKAPKKTKIPTKTKKAPVVQFSHPWLASTLKGQVSSILGIDFSPNGKYIASVADDRHVMMWSTKEFAQKEHKFIAGNIELDHATQVKFSPDSKALVLSLANGNTIRICRIGKKDDGTPGNITTAHDFPRKHKADIIRIGVATNGKFIMSCGRDTTIIIWSIKGDVYEIFDTHQMNNLHAAVSPCGRFVASSGFTPDVKVWEVCFDKSGDFKEVKKAFELKGHSAGVYSFSFNSDSSKMASVSKDGTWKYWDTNIRYEMSQDPYLLQTGNISYTGPCTIALSPDGRAAAIGGGNSVTFFNALSGTEEDTIDNVHTGGVIDLGFDSNSKYMVSVGDKNVHVFHNVTGYRATISDLEEKLKKTSGQSMKDRMKLQITEAKTILDTLLGQSSNGSAH